MVNDHLDAPDFIFEGVGSRGDVVPLICVASEMVRRGYACHLLTNEHFRDEAQAAGISFFSTTDQRVNFVGAEGCAVDKYLFPAFIGVSEYFERLDAADTGAVLVNLDRWAASEPFAERRGIRTIRLHLSPFKIRSIAAPSWPLGANALGVLGETYRKYKLPAMHEKFDTDPRVLSHINGIRQRLELCAVNTAQYANPHVVAQAAFFPRWFAPKASDWPELEYMGFPLPPSREPLPERLLTFLKRVPPPLVFTPGTSVADNDCFFEAAVNCCARLDMPAVFLTPFLRFPRERLRPDAEHFEHIELEPLLPHCAAIVHHGGIGTTARALQAGVPQVISPSVFDQPDNARRVEELGAGTVVARARLDGDALALAVKRCLNHLSAPLLAQHRSELRNDIAIGACADLLERVAGRRSSVDRPNVCTSQPVAGPRGCLPSQEPPLEVGIESELHCAKPVVLIVVWPEPGHTVGPVAMARRLERAGAQVVFAGAGFWRNRLEEQGFDFVDLSAPPGRFVTFSVFANISHSRNVPAAVENLIDAFDFVVARYGPAVVMMDSLYSAFSILAEARGLPWTTYETDLPREFDPGVPPVPQWSGTAAPGGAGEVRSAWARLLWNTYRQRRRSRKLGHPFAYTMESYFPDELCAELRRRLGHHVEFERRSYFPPVAKGARLVLACPELDFERVGAEALTYVGPCIDTEREEASGFPWSLLPLHSKVIYCTLGTQSLREPRAFGLLSAIVAAVSGLSDAFLVVSCPEEYRSQLVHNAARVLVVSDAPQLALLERAKLCIHHAGFNTLKECAFFGVPQVVLPLSHDQFRNAELVERLGIGVGSGLSRKTADAGTLSETIQRVLQDPTIQSSCAALRAVLSERNRNRDLEDFFAAWLHRRAPQHIPDNLVAAPVGESSYVEAVYRGTGADAEFTDRIALVMGRVREFMCAPAEGEDVTVETEFSRLREQLENFRLEYRSCHAELVRRHVGSLRLPELIRALAANQAGGFSEELKAIQQARSNTLERLVQRMASTPLYGR